ncbi:alkyl sulfatase C-terminal domain-containing protein [Streptomyces exfoliatus]|uniref:alkyl sulfatase C-terminal domain-containing protein n=1 Tax=Streptomyces exfoliatus TaxID=1905 RepID=UPI00379ABF10
MGSRGAGAGRRADGGGGAAPARTLTKPQLLGVLAGKGLDGIATTGDPAVLTRLFSYVTKPDPAFPIVTP